MSWFCNLEPLSGDEMFGWGGTSIDTIHGKFEGLCTHDGFLYSPGATNIYGGFFVWGEFRTHDLSATNTMLYQLSHICLYTRSWEAENIQKHFLKLLCIHYVYVGLLEYVNISEPLTLYRSISSTRIT